MSSNDQLLTYLKEVEAAAEDVLSDRQEIVDLDRKRHANREAIRALAQQRTNSWNGDGTKTWLAIGNTFLRVPSDKAKSILEEDQKELDQEINSLRSNLKAKVNNLRDKEGRPELKGFGLRSLNSEEISSVLGPPLGSASRRS